ncbi:MAG: hypothetical protein RL375_329 [Pseudomonadota bacterium]
MAQASLNFDPTATPQAALPFVPFDGVSAAPDDAQQIAASIGRDHAEHALRPPVDLLLAAPALRRGWEAGRLAYAGRHRSARPQVRLWLALRLQAWQEGRHFELLEVTPHYLVQLGAPVCPVTREALTLPSAHTTSGAEARCDSRLGQAQLARINPDAAYAAGNLANLSHTAALAKADLRWNEALACASACSGATVGQPAERRAGLSANAWGRLGVLMSFVTALPHERAARLPLLVLPPNRLRLLNPVQGLQALVTLQLARSGWSQRMPAFEALLPSDNARRDFKTFFMRLLTQALAAGRPDNAQAWRWALEDAWRDPQLQQYWTSFALQLGPTQCERLLAAGAELGLVGQRLVVHSVEQATEGWALDTQGYTTAQMPLTRPAAQATTGSRAHELVQQALAEPSLDDVAPGALTTGRVQRPGTHRELAQPA